MSESWLRGLRRTTGGRTACRSGATASPDEDARSRRRSRADRGRARARGLAAEIVSQRLNRRKIDLIPLPEWSDPPKAQIGELLDAVESPTATRPASRPATKSSRSRELPRPRRRPRGPEGDERREARRDRPDRQVRLGTLGLRRALAGAGSAPGLVLIAGDEFGPLGGRPGSDSSCWSPRPHARRSLSVGVEPSGAAARVLRRGGGPAGFRRMLEDQLSAGAPDVPELDGIRAGRSPSTGSTWNGAYPGVARTWQRVASAWPEHPSTTIPRSARACWLPARTRTMGRTRACSAALCVIGRGRRSSRAPGSRGRSTCGPVCWPKRSRIEERHAGRSASPRWLAQGPSRCARRGIGV